MTKLEELKNKAAAIKNSRNSQHTRNNEYIGGLLLEILNNPKIFEDEELFVYMNSIDFTAVSGTIEDTQEVNGNFLVTPQMTGTSDNELSLMFNNVPEFSSFRITYQTDAPYIGLYLINYTDGGSWSDELGAFIGDGELNTFEVNSSNFANAYNVGDDVGFVFYTMNWNPNTVAIDFAALIP